MTTRERAARQADSRPASADTRSPTIGVDLGGTKILFAVVSPTGRVLRIHRHKSLAQRGPDRVIRDVIGCVRTCLGAPGRAAAAVGIGVAGQVDRDGVVRTAPNLRWNNVPLRRRVEDAVGKPVTVSNDVRAVTYGEWQLGAGQGVDDLVCVFVGTGVGGGIVAGGQLQYGATDTAGEVGHMTLVANGRACRCRNHGCLEAYVGGWAIAERAQEAVRASPAQGAGLTRRAGRVTAISAKTVAEASSAGDPLARRIMAETADYLGAGMVSVVNGMNPKVLVLGGGIVEGTPMLVRRASSIVKARALAVAARPLRVVRAGLGPRAGVLGAAAMARRHVAGGK